MVKSVGFSSDSRRIVSGSTDKTIRLCDMDLGCSTHMLEGRSDGVLCVAFSPDETRIVMTLRWKLLSACPGRGVIRHSPTPTERREGSVDTTWSGLQYLVRIPIMMVYVRYDYLCPSWLHPAHSSSF
ncbi:hypothetical protein JB92DRAFT_2775908 [Gautieria morchelliformis]|nr:hypothetical protein JB92DRAFT_2775908 [Gautieria morchelliformis]